MRLCTEPGCDKKYLAKGYCRNHYRAHGLSPSYGKARPLTAGCTVCGAEFTRVTSRRIANTCSESCRIETIRRAGSARRQNWPQCKVYPRNCRWCGSSFVGRTKVQTLCSSECGRLASLSTQRVPETKPCVSCGADAFRWHRYCEACRAVNFRNTRTIAKDRRRALMRGAASEPISRQHVYERDGWVCGICREPVEPALNAPHPRSKSLDHVVPLARGGAHTYDNVQLAHFLCNSRKSDTMPSDFERGLVR